MSSNGKADTTIVVVMAVVLALALVVPLFAAMSNASAKAKTQSLWGSTGDIRQYPTDSIPGSRQVGVWSHGCALDFTPLGLGSTSWEQAFINYNNRLNTGVLKIDTIQGVRRFQLTFWDNVAVAGVQVWVDGAPFGVETILSDPTSPYDVDVSVDTALLTYGVHVACIQARDTSDNIGASDALVFRVTQ